MAQGRYFFLQSALNDLVLEVSSAPAPGVTVVMQPYQGGKDTQLWYTDPVHDVIRCKADDVYVLHFKDDGSSLIINECSEKDISQKWHFYKDHVENLKTHKSLDIARGCKDAGAMVICWEFKHLPHQIFTRVFVEPKTFQLKSHFNDYCLDVDRSGRAAGTSVISWPEHTGTNQQWYEGPDGMIHSKLNGYVLDSSGDQFNLQPYDGTRKNRQWIRSGQCILNSFDPSRCLEIEDGKDTKGAKLVEGQYSGHKHQQWKAAFV